VLADAQVEKEEWRSENKLWWLKKSIIPFALQCIAMTMMSVLTVSSRTGNLFRRETNTIGIFNFLQIIRKKKEKQFDGLWLRITLL
jgi:hypothetical protein